MRQDSETVLLESAMADYTQGKYEAAQAQLLILQADTTFERSSALALYLGITYLEGDKPDDALLVLAEISPTSLYSPHKVWYSAMAHL